MPSGCLSWLREPCGSSFAALRSLFLSICLSPPLPPLSTSSHPSPGASSTPLLPTYFTFLPLHSHAVLRAVGTVGTFVGVVVAAVETLGKATWSQQRIEEVVELRIWKYSEFVARWGGRRAGYFCPTVLHVARGSRCGGALPPFFGASVAVALLSVVQPGLRRFPHGLCIWDVFSRFFSICGVPARWRDLRYVVQAFAASSFPPGGQLRSFSDLRRSRARRLLGGGAYTDWAPGSSAGLHRGRSVEEGQVVCWCVWSPRGWPLGLECGILPASAKPLDLPGAGSTHRTLRSRITSSVCSLGKGSPLRSLSSRSRSWLQRPLTSSMYRIRAAFVEESALAGEEWDCQLVSTSTVAVPMQVARIGHRATRDVRRTTEEQALREALLSDFTGVEDV